MNGERQQTDIRTTATIAVSDTQREAWQAIRGQLTAARLLVLRAIAAIGPACIRSVADELHWETSTVSGRMHELKTLGLIEKAIGADGKQLRQAHIVRGVTTHGSCWRVRDDWKDFIDVLPFL